ncbi:DUF2007 domain-containing protein [candidate division WOR-3 bacterium]|nr:DUF2007 domain-containing protein [candidate division WOR-3 bacterium]
MKSAYKAPDEFAAITIRSLLENEGMKVWVKSYQISMFDNIAQVMRPYWGEIFVADKDLEQAKSIVEDYLSTDDKK